jgi:hypothetical protein
MISKTISTSTHDSGVIIGHTTTPIRDRFIPPFMTPVALIPIDVSSYDLDITLDLRGGMVSFIGTEELELEVPYGNGSDDYDYEYLVPDRDFRKYRY